MRARIDVVEAIAGTVAWSARGAIRARPSVRLTIEDSRGHRGRGEATPLPGWSRETPEEVVAALERLPWNDALEADPDENAQAQQERYRPGDALDTKSQAEAEAAEHASALTRTIARAVRRVDAALPSARFALESALLDLAGQRSGVPAYRLLSRDAAATAVPLSSLLTGETVDDLLAEASGCLARGIRTLKWKIGRPAAFERELATLRALRLAVGSQVALRLDANGSLPRDQVMARLAALAEIAPELVEEPCVGWLDELGAPPVPLAADESLAAPGGWDSVERAIAAGRCAAIVLKPMLLGGALRCLELARRARSLGAGAIVTHSFDGPVAMAAAASLALALPPPHRAAGLDRHAALASWPDSAVDALPMIGPNAILPLDRPGLGLGLA